MYRIAFFLCAFSTLFRTRLSPSIAESGNQFGLELFYFLNEPGKNVVLSPLSINSSLYMAYLGSDGSTEKNMASVLKLKGTKRSITSDFGSYLSSLEKSRYSSGGYHFGISNFLFLQQGFSTVNQFKRDIQDGFDGKVITVDFKKPSLATRTMNSAISKGSGGVIKDLFSQSEITGATRLVLANSQTFQGNWSTPFPTKRTRNAVFYPYGKEKPTMAKTMYAEMYVPYYENDTLQALALPIKGRKDQGSVACIIVLPKDKSDSTPPFNHLYTGTSVSTLYTRMKQTRVSVALPKVHAAIRIPLTGALQSLGMTTPFSSAANFSGITGKANLALSFFSSAASFTINEFGVSAAAGSGAGFDIKSSRTNKKPVAFVANHPFAYALYDTTSNAIFYIGEYDSPTPETFGSPKVTLVPKKDSGDESSTKLPHRDQTDLNIDNPSGVDESPTGDVE